MESSNLFVMKRSGIYVTRVCTLNCKLCSAYSPYRKSDYFPPVEELCEYIRRFMKIADYCEHFLITGGEPLLYKDLPKLLEYIFRNYSDKIGRMEIITNGTIVPNSNLLETVKKYESKFFRFLIDDYGETLSKKVNMVVSAISDFNLPFKVVDYNSQDPYYGGWVDFGRLNKQIHTPDEAMILNSKCAQKQKINFCFPIIEGKMVPCGPVGRRITLGTVLPDEYIDLMDDALTVEEQREKISLIYNSPCLETCKYCNGVCDDSPRFRPAEQLTSEEINKIRSKTI